jgi:hypothetical protein
MTALVPLVLVLLITSCCRVDETRRPPAPCPEQAAPLTGVDIGPDHGATEAPRQDHGVSWRPFHHLDDLIRRELAQVGSKQPPSTSGATLHAPRLSPAPLGSPFHATPVATRDKPSTTRLSYQDRWLELVLHVNRDPSADHLQAAWRAVLRAGIGADEVVRHEHWLFDNLFGAAIGPHATCGGRLYAGVALADISAGSSTAIQPELHVFSWPLEEGRVAAEAEAEEQEARLRSARPTRYEGAFPLGHYSRHGAAHTRRGSGAVLLLPDCQVLGLLLEQDVQSYEDEPLVAGAAWTLEHGDPAACGPAGGPNPAPEGEVRWLSVRLGACQATSEQTGDDSEPAVACELRGELWYALGREIHGDYQEVGVIHHDVDPIAWLARTEAPTCWWRVQDGVDL